MISPTGFTTNAAFHKDGTLATPSVLNIGHLYYNGSSQGGIMGGALTAVSPDFTRAVARCARHELLGALAALCDFDQFAEVLYPAYPDEESRPLIFDLMQLLWDRGEPDGLRGADNVQPAARHAGTPGAYGRGLWRPPGHRLSGRCRGAPRSARRPHRPVLFEGRWPGGLPLWSVPAITRILTKGSAIYYWDGGPIRETSPGSGQFVGTEPPPFENLPNRSGEDPPQPAALDRG